MTMGLWFSMGRIIAYNPAMVKAVGIVSLSRGLMGERFVKHEVEIGLKRLSDYGLDVKIMPNADKGLDYLQAHPEKRAQDLLTAFGDSSLDMILCAIGGDDTYRLLPYLFEHDELKNAVSDKIFLGFSDSTVNHFMLHKVGLKTFYGQSFISDICEIGPTMLPYSEQYFSKLISSGRIDEITPSPVWYESREDYSVASVGTVPVSHPDRGFVLLQGSPVFSGKILGGCLDTMYDFFDPSRYADMPVLCRKYNLFPSAEEWKGRILLFETSEERMSLEMYEKALGYLKDAGVFDSVNGVLVGKPENRFNEEGYFKALVKVIDNPHLPVVCNVNIGHANPRCIIPFGVEMKVDCNNQVITLV